MGGGTSEDKPWHDESLLRTLYKEKELDILEIADELDTSRNTISSWLYRHGIREPSGTKPYHDKEKLEHVLFDKGLSPEELAKRWDCSKVTVEEWCRRHGISRREAVENPQTPWRNEERLRELYTGLGLSTQEVGDLLGCEGNCILTWLNKYDIETSIPKYREWTEIQKIKNSDEETVETVAERINVPVEVVEQQLNKYEDIVETELEGTKTHSRKSSPWQDKEILEDLYWDEGLTTYEISERLQCSPSTITRWLHRHDISLKKDKKPPWQNKETLEELYLEKEWSAEEIASELGCHESTIWEWFHRFGINKEQGGPWRDEDRLREMYVNQKMSVTEIGEELGCSHTTISYWLARHEINTRTSKDITHRLFGDSHELPDFHNKELLHQLYVEERKSVVEISNQLGCSESAIRNNIERFGIQRNNEFSLDKLNNSIPETEPWKDRELFKELYIEHELSQKEISEIFGCGTTKTYQWRKRHGIENRVDMEVRPSCEELLELYVEEELAAKEVARKYNVSTSTVQSWLKDEGIDRRSKSHYKHPHLSDESKLREMYIEEGMSMMEIGDELGAGPSTVREALNKFGIELRPVREYITGPKNPFWQGGQFPYGKGWNEQKRKKVLEKYGYICQSCGMTQDEHKEEFGQELHIHHIQKARNIDDPEERNSVSNLVPLCSKCHQKWEGIPLKPTFLSD